jgi:hypothetical protein
MIRVSRLLSQYGLVDAEWWTDEGRTRGTIVHEISENVMRQQAVTVSPTYAGYLNAVQRAMAALHFVPLFIERRLTNWKYGITGRPDALGYLPDPVGELPAGPTVLDIKSGSREPSHGIQLAFYEWLAEGTEDVRAQLPAKFVDMPWQRLGVYLRPNGRYSLRRYNEFSDRDVVRGLIDVTLWRIREGLIKVGTESSQPDDAAMPQWS